MKSWVQCTVSWEKLHKWGSVFSLWSRLRSLWQRHPGQVSSSHTATGRLWYSRWSPLLVGSPGAQSPAETIQIHSSLYNVVVHSGTAALSEAPPAPQPPLAVPCPVGKSPLLFCQVPSPVLPCLLIPQLIGPAREEAEDTSAPGQVEERAGPVPPLLRQSHHLPRKERRGTQTPSLSVGTEVGWRTGQKHAVSHSRENGPR